MKSLHQPSLKGAQMNNSLSGRTDRLAAMSLVLIAIGSAGVLLLFVWPFELVAAVAMLLIFVGIHDQHCRSVQEAITIFPLSKGLT